MNSPDYIDDNEVAKILGKSVITIRNWRSKGTAYGPRFFKIGHNVRYRREDIGAWIETCVVDPSSREGKAA